ncbi:hypothetical protein EXIGLDRAFT_779174 [Exidia glandulosa HHB12029]|uniref:Uncharacterized protein n=1 Tax=Exidia glandulosa HHB12029 TaxID=1314781 RepID=A0A165ZEC9_EXIGL|nr:hypothetical protein EXIGLDRAFT_779174 [Exidia glandulosa HHB12029]
MLFLRTVIAALGLFTPVTDLILTATFVRGGLIAVLHPFSPMVISACVALVSSPTCATISRWLLLEEQDASADSTARPPTTRSFGDDLDVCPHLISVNATLYIPPLDLVTGRTTMTGLVSQAKAFGIELPGEILPILETTAAGAYSAVSASHILLAKLSSAVNLINRVESAFTARLMDADLLSLRQVTCGFIGWVADPLMSCAERRLPYIARDALHQALDSTITLLHDLELSVQDVVSRLVTFVGDTSHVGDLVWVEETAADAMLLAVIHKSWTGNGDHNLQMRRDISSHIRTSLSRMRCSAQGELLALSELQAEVVELARGLETFDIPTYPAVDEALHVLRNGRRRVEVAGKKVERGFRSRLSVNLA